MKVKGQMSKEESGKVRKGINGKGMEIQKGKKGNAYSTLRGIEAPWCPSPWLLLLCHCEKNRRSACNFNE